MFSYPTVSKNLERYIDAGFPILYISTFEESKADKLIGSIADARRSKVLEWNGANGFVNFKTKSPILPNLTLKDTLKLLMSGNQLHRKLLVIKDANDQLKGEQGASSEAVALLKEIARKITNLPLELKRKGRFDEIFYVELPTKEERKNIFEIHIKKRRPNDLRNIDIDRLADETKEFTGADIEGVINDSIESAFTNGKTSLTTDDVLSCRRETHSLAETMPDVIKKNERRIQKRQI